MQLLCCVSLFSAFYGFHFSAKHVPGVLNEVADALSHDKIAHTSSYFAGPPVSSVQTAPQAAHLRETRLGLSVLDRIVLQLAECGIAESTKKVYESGQRRFLTFCQQHSRNPLPATEVLLCHFVAFLASSGLSYGSVRSYLSAVRHLHIISSLPDPSLSSFPRLEYVLKGLRHKGVLRPRAKRLPITPTLLRRIHSTWSNGPLFPDRFMLWAAFCLGFLVFSERANSHAPLSQHAPLRC